jgi:hypothetical protein
MRTEKPTGMKWGARIRRYFMWRVIDIALRKNAPSMITTSGEKGRQNDCYVVYFIGLEDAMRFVTNEMNPSGVTGKWSTDGQNFVAECSVPYAALSEYTLYILHYYRGWAFYSKGIPSFVLKYVGSYPFLRVMIDRALQMLFNRRKLTRRDRMKVLKHILAETIKDRKYHAHETQLLTHFYSVRWVYRSDKDELMTYYRLLLDSLKESNDLEAAESGYILKPQALNTITDYEQEERRHNENAKTQRGIYLLTGILMVVGVVQAASSAIQVWQSWGKP